MTRTSRLAVVVAWSIATFVSCGGGEKVEQLPGAELVGGGGDVWPRAALQASDVALDDLVLTEAFHMVPDGEGGLWIVFGKEGGRVHGGTLLHVRGGHVDGGRALTTADGTKLPTNFAASADPGHVVLASPGEEIWAIGLDEGDERRIAGPPLIGGVATTEDGAILVADHRFGKVTAYALDGTAQDVVTVDPSPPANPDIANVLPISPVRLSDDRFALIIDDFLSRSLVIVGADRSMAPVTSGRDEDTPATMVPTEDDRLVVLRGEAMFGSSRPIGGPGQRIEVLDPDHPLDERVLIDGYQESPSSMAVLGDDLYVLYGGRLWKLDGVLAQ